MLDLKNIEAHLPQTPKGTSVPSAPVPEFQQLIIHHLFDISRKKIYNLPAPSIYKREGSKNNESSICQLEKL